MTKIVKYSHTWLYSLAQLGYIARFSQPSPSDKFMETFTEISPKQAWEILSNAENDVVLVDIRDAIRFQYSRPQGAFHLTNLSYGKFLDEVDYDQPVLVCCYHGVSSRNTAQFLVEQGFERVYSVKGGFDGWVRAGLPIETAY